MWWARLLNVISGLLAGGVAASTTSYESISTVTVGAGGSTTITFSSIPSTYKHLQVRCIAKNTYTAAAGNDNLTMQFNSDTASNYSRHALYGTGSSALAFGVANATFAGAGIEPRSNAAESNVFSASVIDILDYADTNKYKTVRSLSGSDRNGAGDIYFVSGNWRSTSAITSITMGTDLNPFAQYSHFALYGIKG